MTGEHLFEQQFHETYLDLTGLIVHHHAGHFRENFTA